MTISFRQLEIFEKVARTGHVTRAGEELLLTQSAISMAVSQLESLTGAPLFERSGRRLILNDRGRLLLAEAGGILQAVRRLEQRLQKNGGELTGELLVGGSTTVGNYLLPALLGAFARMYPKTRVQLRVGNTRQVVAWVEEGKLDIAFIEGPCHSRGVVAVPWRDDELVVVAGPDHAWGMEGGATAEMLASAPWVMRERGSGTREVFEAAMDALGVSYSIALELGHTEAIKNGVASGLGVSCLSRLAVHRELEHGWLVAIDSPLALTRSLALIRRRASFRTPLVSAFLDVAQGAWDVAGCDGLAT
ncbi:LysR family transcriptional regulator [Geobacter sp. FeAm09]|uniref:LysR substrate-binding domain-containing protein n=1 Tax=Geobacter sp. FeAm09 TaxID=2597769 RepID=UPI0011ED6B6D|nr:LysR substrate-binding domain-containing protein [Geobacter sp. FeAm09]QEM69413.1 LysR family transcriptional regulator [Geobacter sp. FeAm09]